jgi:hypothetical protein
MGDIYPKAGAVYVWLGDATPGTDRAMAYLADERIQEYFITMGEQDLRIPSLVALRFALRFMMWSRWNWRSPQLPYGCTAISFCCVHSPR